MEKVINLFVGIFTGGKYMYVKEKDVAPVIVLEKIDKFDVDEIFGEKVVE